MSHPDDRALYLRCGYSLSISQQQAIQQVIADLVQRLPAHFALLVDVSGQVIAFHSASKQVASTVDQVALGALVAGDLAASQEIARLAGEYQECQMVLREGQKAHLIISEAGSRLAFLVRVSKEVPLGWARMLIREASQRFALSSQAADNDESIRLDKATAENFVDSLGQALDSIWAEDRDVR